MELGALVENHPFPLAPNEGLDPNLGEVAKTWDDRSFGLRDVVDSERNNIIPSPRL